MPVRKTSFIPRVEQLEDICVPVQWPVNIPQSQVAQLLGTYGQYQEFKATLRDAGIHLHEGIDIAAAASTPVRAVMTGIVEASFRDARAGNFDSVVVIRDVQTDSTGKPLRNPDGGFKLGDKGWNYRHVIPAQGLRDGQLVQEGDVIGQVATWPGVGYGDHLHLDRGLADRTPGQNIATRDPTMANRVEFTQAQNLNPALPDLVRSLRFAYAPTINPLTEFLGKNIAGVVDEIKPTVASIDFRVNADDPTLAKNQKTERVRNTVRYFQDTVTYGQDAVRVVGANAVARAADGKRVSGRGDGAEIDFVVEAFDQFGSKASPGEQRLNPLSFDFTVTGKAFKQTSGKVASFDFSGFPKEGIDGFFQLKTARAFYENDTNHDSVMSVAGPDARGPFFYAVTNSPRVNAAEGKAGKPTDFASVANGGYAWRSDAKAGSTFYPGAASQAKNNAASAYPDDIYNVTVRATDLADLTGEKTVTILLNNWQRTLTTDKAAYAANEEIKVAGSQFRARQDVNFYLVPVTKDGDKPQKEPAAGTKLEDAQKVGTLTTIKISDNPNDPANGTFSSAAKLTIPAGLAAGTYHLVADYDGDGIYTPRLDVATQVTIKNANKQPAKADLTGPDDIVYQGQAIQLTALVSADAPGQPAPPTGVVGFFADGGFLGAVSAVNGAAAYTLPALVGSHTFAAVYYGDDTYDAAEGSLTSEVAAHTISTTTSASPSTAAFGDSILLSASVASNEETAIPVGGEVAFYLGDEYVGSAPVEDDGTASLSIGGPERGSGLIRAVYSGDEVFAESSASAAYTVTDNAPAAAPDTALAHKNTSVGGNVLGNDTDVDADTLSASVYSGPSHGTLTLSADGSFVYTPNTDYTGSDSFTYAVDDGYGGSATATVTIAVADTPAPVGTADGYTAAADIVVDAANGVLANDTAPNGGALVATLASGPRHGALALSPDGSFVYTPDDGFTGSDSFTYYPTDADGPGPATLVNLVVTDHPPQVEDDAATTSEETPVTLAVLANDTDADGTPLAILGVSDGAFGTTTVNADGTITYTPDRNRNGTDTFTYVVDDGYGRSAVGTATVTVTPVNDTPAIGSDQLITPQDTAIDVDLRSLATDVETAPEDLTFAVSWAQNGTVELLADGHTARFTPNPGYAGPASFSVSVTDTGDGDSAPLTAYGSVSVLVDAPPVAYGANLSMHLAPGETAAIHLFYYDPDGGAVTLVDYTLPDRGSIGVAAGGFQFNYTAPDPAFVGATSFTYTVRDGEGNEVTRTVTVNLTNQPPQGSNASASTSSGTPVGVGAWYYDPDGDALAVSVSQPSVGSVGYDQWGQMVYTPPSNFTGQVTFSMVVDDGHGGSLTIYVTVNVT
jgi:VCBS repeat-containing protein